MDRAARAAEQKILDRYHEKYTFNKAQRREVHINKDPEEGGDGDMSYDDLVDDRGEPWTYRTGLLRSFLANNAGLVVTDAAVTEICDLKLTFSDGSWLDVMIDISQADRDCYVVFDRAAGHVAVTGGPDVSVIRS